MKAYLINNDSKEKREFQYNPESVPYTREANFNDINSPGMCYPLTQFNGGKVREFEVKFLMYDRPYTGKIDSMRTFLEGLMPPEFNADYLRPPVVTFAYGYFVRNCVVKKLSVNDEILDEQGRPTMTEFTLSFRQIGVAA